MDGRLERGRVQEAEVQVQRHGQVQGLRLLSASLKDAVDQRAHLGVGQPVGVALQGAFGRHAHHVQPVELAEPLQEGAVGQAGAEGPVGFAQEHAG